MSINNKIEKLNKSEKGQSDVEEDCEKIFPFNKEYYTHPIFKRNTEISTFEDFDSDNLFFENSPSASLFNSKIEESSPNTLFSQVDDFNKDQNNEESVPLLEK